MRVVVTGGAGFIGSHLVRALEEGGSDVLALDDLSYGRRANLPAGARLLVLDVADHDALLPLLDGAKAVVHLAAIASVPFSIRHPLAAHRANGLSTLSVLEAARRAGVGRVILASSAAVYGDGEDVQAETARPNPQSFYAVDKLFGERSLALYHGLHGLRGLALRFFNVYGPRQAAEGPYGAVIPLWIRQALAGEPLTVFGDGLQTRDFTHVADVVDGILRALEAPEETLDGQPVNLARGEGISLLALGEAIRRATGSRSPTVFAPARPGDIRHSRADISKARRMLGFQPRVELDEGIRDTVGWMRSSS